MRFTRKREAQPSERLSTAQREEIRALIQAELEALGWARMAAVVRGGQAFTPIANLRTGEML